MKIDEKKLKEEIKENFETREFQLLLKSYQQLIKLKSENPDYWLDYIQFILQYYEEFDIDEWDILLEKGIKTCQLARKSLPENKHAQFYLYEYKLMIELIKFEPSYHEKYDDEKLQNIINKAVESEPYNPDAHFEKGNFLSAMGQMDNAEKEYEISTQLRGKDNFDLLLYTNKAANNEQNKNYKEAISDYEVILKNIDNKYLIFVTYHALLRIYKKMEDQDKIKYYKNLIEDME